jgi:hypothetical protein
MRRSRRARKQVCNPAVGGEVDAVSAGRAGCRLEGIRRPAHVRPGGATARPVAAPGDHPLPATRSGSARRPRAVLNFRPLRPITEP